MVAVVDKNGSPLMPTTEARARILLKKGRAVKFKYRPFTIKIVDREGGDTQPIEYSSDTGYIHVGVSIKSEKHEYVHAQYDLRTDEKDNHDAQRKYRRTRRNRLRYRAPGCNNRKKKHDLAPSIQHKLERQEDIFCMYAEVMPITKAVFETGKFDTQVLKAIEEGKPLPEGEDYQHGGQYGFYTLRQAVFFRDNFTCAVCGESIKDGAILRTHHIGYLENDHSNRMNNLLTVCSKCHTSANHKEGGALYGLKPKTESLASEAFMNTVRWRIINDLKAEYPNIEFHNTYGAFTATVRKNRNISKTHANDAYCIGCFFPKHKAKETKFQKNKRNDRCLQRFYDARYIDIRDGEEKSGSALNSGRTGRGKYGENLRIYRGKKTSKGHFAIRKGRTQLLPGSKVSYNDEVKIVKGTHRKTNVEFTTPASDGKKSASINKINVLWSKSILAWEEMK